MLCSWRTSRRFKANSGLERSKVLGFLRHLELPADRPALALVVAVLAPDHHRRTDGSAHGLCLSHFLVSCAASMFIGPCFSLALIVPWCRGADHMVTFIVLFSVTQGIGGLAGPALFGTFQHYREREYSVLIPAHTQQTDPTVALRLAIQSQVYNPVVTDPPLKRARPGRAIANS